MEEGISFIVRVHNEEKTLEKSLRSIFSLTFPHEIIVILHRCTDKSSYIAHYLAGENPHIQIVEYEYPVSRAGYENLVTDKDSNHSLVYYSRWCIQHARFLYTFRWDADFVASSGLINFLNGNMWSRPNLSFKIVAKNSTTENCEFYLSSGLETYSKYLFWEAPVFNEKTIGHQVHSDVYIIHDSELSDLKPYWNQKPWFYSDDSDEARILRDRYDQLTKDFGPEIIGMSRASNQECHNFFYKLVAAQPKYIKFTE